MLKVGITGSIASGKTAVLQHLEQKGYKTFCCDQAVRKIYSEPSFITKIQHMFPNQDVSNKRIIADIIYSDPLKKMELEKTIHPLVEKELNSFLLQNREQDKTFMEIPLLFEANWEKYCDVVIVLYCAKNLRMERAKLRDIDEDLFNLINASQLDDKTKIDKADYSIDSSKEWSEVIKELELILAKI